MTETGMTPSTVTVGLGGQVMWVNQGTQVHTATTNATPGLTIPQAFDTGGLGAGQSKSVSFALAGTYTYTSATDCLGFNHSAVFKCGPYSVVVTGTPAAAGASAPVPSTAAPGSAPASATPAPLPIGPSTVVIDDGTGFNPATLTIKANTTVTWLNSGQIVHTVTSSPGTNPGFDSGGLSPNQSFSYYFTTPGNYSYHSATEQVNNRDPNTGNITISWRFNGTITVTQ